MFSTNIFNAKLFIVLPVNQLFDWNIENIGVIILVTHWKVQMSPLCSLCKKDFK